MGRRSRRNDVANSINEASSMSPFSHGAACLVRVDGGQDGSRGCVDVTTKIPPVQRVHDGWLVKKGQARQIGDQSGGRCVSCLVMQTLHCRREELKQMTASQQKKKTHSQNTHHPQKKITKKHRYSASGTASLSRQTGWDPAPVHEKPIAGNLPGCAEAERREGGLPIGCRCCRPGRVPPRQKQTRSQCGACKAVKDTPPRQKINKIKINKEQEQEAWMRFIARTHPPPNSQPEYANARPCLVCGKNEKPPGAQAAYR